MARAECAVRLPDILNQWASATQQLATTARYHPPRSVPGESAPSASRTSSPSGPGPPSSSPRDELAT
eukprot:97423-Rhodomonas_salina.1